LKVTNSEGEILEAYDCSSENSQYLVNNVFATASAMNSRVSTTTCKGTQVIDPRVAYIITDILKDNNARSPSFGSNSQLVIPNHNEVAVKTGTSNNLRDNLTIGYNQKYTVAVWVGNNNNSEMARIASGVTGASPIFNKIMSALLSDQDSVEWKVPEKLVQVPICSITGTLACEGCPKKLEWFLEENQPKKYCSPDWFKKDEGTENKEGENKNSTSKPEVQYQFFEDSQNKISKSNQN
jgi:membrane carboxypeptidase/penicillin-binding protein PbpC